MDFIGAIDNLTLTVPQGAIYGFLGANGAGKTTLLKVISGIYQIESGSIDINGKKKGVKIWAIITIVTIATMVVLIFVPIIKHLLLKV